MRLLADLSHERLFEVLKTAADLPDVKREVQSNHDDNRWWPMAVTDWRLRMVIAGWSSRISYNMITVFRKVISDVNTIGYDQLCEHSNEELHDLILPLGLFNARMKYLRSVATFIRSLEYQTRTPFEMPNDELIEHIVRNVEGASYKVAQCAALYAKGYHCGIFPIDSGMKDRLGPCIGLHLPGGSVAHEVMRKHLERIIHIHPHEYTMLARNTGYEHLSLPVSGAPTWWAHLVLIYFKRLYCNNGDPYRCPLRSDPKLSQYIGAMCSRAAARTGGYNYVVLEGLDRVGKSAMAHELKALGYNLVHSRYDPNHADILSHYETLIRGAVSPVVFDRIFISEYVYGRVLRERSRLSQEAFCKLMELLSRRNSAILYLKEDIELIRKRLLSSRDRHETIAGRLHELNAEYDRCMVTAANYVPVYEIRPSSLPSKNPLNYALQMARAGYER